MLRVSFESQVSAVTKTTGFAAGLYEGEELESGAIKDKDAKLNYLKKIIDCIGICLGEELDVRGAKVRMKMFPLIYCTSRQR